MKHAAGVDASAAAPSTAAEPLKNGKRPRKKRPTAAEKRAAEALGAVPGEEDDDEADDPGPKKKGRRPSVLDANDKRKRQNRAAQRAFRERKEKHVRDLEVKAAVQDEQLLVFRGIVSQLQHEVDALRRGEQVLPTSFVLPTQFVASPPAVHQPSPGPSDAEYDQLDPSVSPARPTPTMAIEGMGIDMAQGMGTMSNPAPVRGSDGRLAPLLASTLSSEIAQLQERERKFGIIAAGSGARGGSGLGSTGMAGMEIDVAMELSGMGTASMGLGMSPQVRTPVSMERGQSAGSANESPGVGTGASSYGNNGYEERAGLGGLLERGGAGTIGSPLARASYGLSSPGVPMHRRSSPRILQQPLAPLATSAKMEDANSSAPSLESQHQRNLRDETAASLALDDNSFDFDAPFDFSYSESIPLPPLFQDLFDTPYNPSAGSTAHNTPRASTGGFAETNPSNASTILNSTSSTVKDEDVDEDICPIGDDFSEPPPLPNGRLPCDKPECDFSIISCALPIPWRPKAVEGGGSDRDVWICKVAWAKLCSHPMFGGCDVDELCHELRDKTRCSDDGRLVIAKADVCAVFRSIPQRARTRRERIDLEGSGARD